MTSIHSRDKVMTTRETREKNISSTENFELNSHQTFTKSFQHTSIVHNFNRLLQGVTDTPSVNAYKNSFFLRGKTIQMSELLHTECPGIILCQETKVDQHISSNELFPKDLVTFRKDRSSAGGGICITANRKLRVTHFSNLYVSDREAVWVQVHTDSFTPLYICSIYSPPDKGPDYIELLRKPLEALTHRHPHKPPFIIIGGDLNYPTLIGSQ